MPYRYQIEIDFVRDFADRLRAELKQMGYAGFENKDHRVILDMYFNLKRRMIYPAPRKVLKSKEFLCPPYLQQGLDQLIEKIEKGIEIKPHLSKQIENLEYNDDLLNDWGIYHLHLGTHLEKDGFISRTGPLLFARFDDDHAYLINVMKHGDWAKQECVRIIHNNWPESIQHSLLKGAYKLEHNVTDEVLKKLRKHHIVTFVELENNIIYAPLGMGYQSNGLSTEVVMITNRYINTLKQYENHIKENIVKYVEILENHGAPNIYELSFLLGIKDNTVYAFEGHSNISIKLGKLW